MMQPQYQESSIVKEYALAIIVVCVVSCLWIFFNEVVMKVGNVTLDMVAGTAADLVYFLILINRIIPIGIILGVFVWIFIRAVKREPYSQFTG